MSGESLKDTPGTKRKAPPGAKPKVALAKKAKLENLAKEDAVQAFWNNEKTRATASPSNRLETLAGIFITYDQMVMKRGERTATEGFIPVPGEYDGDEAWEETGWSCYVPAGGEGKRNALWFPVWSETIQEEALLKLPEGERKRCVYDEGMSVWRRVPRWHVNEKGSAGKFMANCVRAARVDETPNCRYVVDWDHVAGKDPEYLRVILVSTHKCEKGHEWRFDGEYAERIFRNKTEPVAESDSEESVAEVVPTGGTTSRPQSSAKAQSLAGFGLPDVSERLATALESNTTLLCMIAERLSDQVKGAEEDRRIAAEDRRIATERHDEFLKVVRDYYDEIKRVLLAVNYQGAGLRLEFARGMGIPRPNVGYAAEDALLRELADDPLAPITNRLLGMAEDWKGKGAPTEEASKKGSDEVGGDYSPSK